MSAPRGKRTSRQTPKRRSKVAVRGRLKPWLRRMLIALPIAGAFLILAYVFVLRPWHVGWGATEAEVNASLPGDDLITKPRISSTRAITIHAPAADIWPWLAQMGYQRGGWYSYDSLERMIGVGDFIDGHSARRIIPELQELEIGDVIRTDPGGGPTVVEVVPGRTLLLHSKIVVPSARHLPLDAPLTGGCFHSSWLFFLDQLDETSTRLITRFQAEYEPGIKNSFFAFVALEPATFVMERKMLGGIRDRAEDL